MRLNPHGKDDVDPKEAGRSLNEGFRRAFKNLEERKRNGTFVPLDASFFGSDTSEREVVAVFSGKSKPKSSG